MIDGVNSIIILRLIMRIIRNAWRSVKKVLVGQCGCCGAAMKWCGWMYQWGRAGWFTPGQAPLLWRTACSAEPVRWAWCQTWAQCCSTCPAIQPGREKQEEETGITLFAKRLQMEDFKGRIRQNLYSETKNGETFKCACWHDTSTEICCRRTTQNVASISSWLNSATDLQRRLLQKRLERFIWCTACNFLGGWGGGCYVD